MSDPNETFAQAYANIVRARAKIVDDAKGKRGVTGQIVCPACGRSLKYSIAKVNGHVWGACETDGCLRWME